MSEEVKDMETEVDEQREEEIYKELIKKQRIGTLLRLLLIVILLALLFVYPLGVSLVRGIGMRPNLNNSDVVLFQRDLFGGDYKLSDVVVYKLDGDEHYRVGRIVATPETTVSFNDAGELYLDGYPSQINVYTYTFYDKDRSSKDIALGADEFYILNDNRDDFNDSRQVGVISREQIAGRVFSLVRKRDI